MNGDDDFSQFFELIKKIWFIGVHKTEVEVEVEVVRLPGGDTETELRGLMTIIVIITILMMMILMLIMIIMIVISDNDSDDDRIDDGLDDSDDDDNSNADNDDNNNNNSDDDDSDVDDNNVDDDDLIKWNTIIAYLSSSHLAAVLFLSFLTSTTFLFLPLFSFFPSLSI